jgi:hypothetical protein
VRRSPGPGGLSALAVVVGWIGVLFAFRGHWLGVVLPLLTTALAWLALRRGEAMGRQRSAELQRALDAATVRTRELERLRHPRRHHRCRIDSGPRIELLVHVADRGPRPAASGLGGGRLSGRRP